MCLLEYIAISIHRRLGANILLIVHALFCPSQSSGDCCKSHAVDAIFEALCAGAEANPDDMEEDHGDFFFDQAEVQAGMENDEDAQQRLAAFEDRLQLPDADGLAGMQLQDGPVNGARGAGHRENGAVPDPQDAEQ